VKHFGTLAIALGVTLWLPLAAYAADEPVPPAEAQAAPPKCLEAVVNPVTGFAICTNPRGAPVEPPPRETLNRPCKPREHDDDPFTVYEHWSGCHE
jgi:hypothetical protein